MKKTRRFVALLLAAVLALALFTACGAAGAEEPQSAIGKVYEDWFVEKLNSKWPADKPVQKVDVKRSELYRINEYDIVTRVIDGKTYAAMYIHLEKAHS